MFTTLTGSGNVLAALSRAGNRLNNTLPLMRRLGIMLRTEYTKTMQAGVDPDGNRLRQVQRWTRSIGAGAGEGRDNSRATPLMNTGMLRNSMGTVRVSKDELEFGWKGNQLEKAAAMINGTPGRMRVRRNEIRKSKTGSRYVRIQTNDGRWFTKVVTDGTIPITPQKRNFFFLGRRQEARVVSYIDSWVEEVVQEKKRA